MHTITYKKIFQKILAIFFTLNAQLHQHITRGNKLIVPNVNITGYESNSVPSKAIKQWNELQNFVKTQGTNFCLAICKVYFIMLVIFSMSGNNTFETSDIADPRYSF